MLLFFSIQVRKFSCGYLCAVILLLVCRFDFNLELIYFKLTADWTIMGWPTWAVIWTAVLFSGYLWIDRRITKIILGFIQTYSVDLSGNILHA